MDPISKIMKTKFVLGQTFKFGGIRFLADQDVSKLKKRDKDPTKQNKDPEKDIVSEDRSLDERKHEELHEVLLLLATFAVVITYMAGLNPLGGFWGSTQDGHRVSNPVLQDVNSRRYKAFFVCNTTAFVASLLIIMLLLDKKVNSIKMSFQFRELYGCIVVALFGLVGAYAAGSCREADDTVNKRHNVAMEKACSLVMLLATLAASITYQAGLDPPGGLWPDDQEGHKGGYPILLTTHPTRYRVFFYSNSVAFVTSLVAIIMVQSSYVLRNHTLEAAMLLDLFALICVYAAGSCREHGQQHHDPHEEDNREVLLLLAILVATLTYQAGLTPPGGFRTEDDSHGHQPGNPVLLENYPSRYEAFFYCNATSFMASISLIILLVNPNLYRPGTKCYALSRLSPIFYDYS
uniref:PGG domain-containing protein n=1 Tax=Oryza brachyantha TaxID=4533 RepID=J3MDE0_ORYBR